MADYAPDEAVHDAMVMVLLQHVWLHAPTTKADHVRSMADEVAECASRGFITTQIIPGRHGWGRIWKITPTGCAYLFENAARIADLFNNEEDA